MLHAYKILFLCGCLLGTNYLVSGDENHGACAEAKTEELIRKANERYRVTNEYLKKYLYVIKKYRAPRCSNSVSKSSNIIWQLWLQGVDNAPCVVKTCLESVRRYAGNRKVILLSENDIEKYVQLPDYVWRKYRNGQMKPAHFADIVRSALLYKYGGIWIDATVFLSKPLPEKLLKNDLFMFQISKEKERERRQSHLYANWFIVAKQYNRFIKLSLDYQLEYWKHEDKAIDYFETYSMYSLIVKHDKASYELYRKMPYYPETISFYPQMSKTWIKDTYNLFLQADNNGLGIHKLNYNKKHEKMKPGTFYDFFCKLHKE